jgi:hypothetical protein
MEHLHQWLEAPFALKQVKPNSGLGKASTYLLRHWKGLAAFLREAGAPLEQHLRTCRCQSVRLPHPVTAGKRADGESDGMDALDH